MRALALAAALIGAIGVAMSTVARPVTQIVETAVNRASGRGVTCPSEAITGSEKIAVNSRMRTEKMSTAKREGDAVARSRIAESAS